ncbi:SURF1 family protein, partial [Pseudoxanthomonas sp. X-1]
MSRRLPPAAGWALALLVAAVFCGLGTWQLGRAKQKRAMLAQVAQVLHERQPQPLADAAQHGHAQDFAWAAGTGRFAPGPAVLLDNQTLQGQAGVRAYRVFVPDAGGVPLLVDLGWQPLDAQRRLPPVPALADTRRIAGL